MARRFVTYNTEDAEKLGIDQRGVLQPGAGDDSGNGSDSFIRKVTEMTPGYVSCKTGAFGTGGNWHRTDYIPVSSGDVITFSGRIGDNVGVAGYDENKVFVTSVLDRIDESSGYTYENEPLTIPDGVKYIAGCTISKAYPITVMVYSDMQAFADAMSGNWLPNVTTDDNGKLLGVVGGALGLVDAPMSGAVPIIRVTTDQTGGVDYTSITYEQISNYVSQGIFPKVLHDNRVYDLSESSLFYDIMPTLIEEDITYHIFSNVTAYSVEVIKIGSDGSVAWDRTEF